MFWGDVWSKNAVLAKTTTSRWVCAISRTRKTPENTEKRMLEQPVHRKMRIATSILAYTHRSSHFPEFCVYSSQCESVLYTLADRKMRIPMSIRTLDDTNLRWNRNSRATCALILAHIGAQIPSFQRKIANHEQSAHWFWRILPLKFSHFSPKWRFTSNLRTFTKNWPKLRWNPQSRAPCTLMLAQIGAQILSFQPKNAFHG